MKSELQPLRGELLMTSGAGAEDIEAALCLARAIARRQNAAALELRAVKALAHRQPNRKSPRG